jgi:8-oxo-dGTP pyrophosphatase MutT (NUDIX family)
VDRRRPDTAGEPVAARPAATVVLVRAARGRTSTAGVPIDGIEVLLTRRPTTMAFAGGMMVFPGGRLEPADADPRLVARSTLTPPEAARRLGGGLDPETALGLHHVAIRELFEEAGVLLLAGAERPSTDALMRARSDLLDGTDDLAGVAIALDLRFDLEGLVPIAYWVTPAAYGRRFDARFFAAELPSGAEPTFVGDEVADHRWAEPRAALASMAAADIEMWIPTSSTLQRLSEAESFDAIHERLAIPALTGTHAEPTPPVLDPASDGVLRLTCHSAGGVPGRAVETYLVGHRAFVVVDPGDPSPEALAAILAAAASSGGQVVAIALSSPDPDRSAGADELAERTGAVIFGPPGSGRDLPFPVTELADGALIAAGDRPLRVTIVSTDPPKASFSDQDGRQISRG